MLPRRGKKTRSLDDCDLFRVQREEQHVASPSTLSSSSSSSSSTRLFDAQKEKNHDELLCVTDSAREPGDSLSNGEAGDSLTSNAVAMALGRTHGICARAADAARCHGSLGQGVARKKAFVFDLDALFFWPARPLVEIIASAGT